MYLQIDLNIAGTGKVCIYLHSICKKNKMNWLFMYE